MGWQNAGGWQSDGWGRVAGGGGGGSSVTVPDVGTGQRKANTVASPFSYSGLTPTGGNYALIMLGMEDNAAESGTFSATFNSRSMTSISQGGGIVLAAFAIAITGADYGSAATVSISWSGTGTRGLSAIGYTVSGANATLGTAFSSATNSGSGTTIVLTPSATGATHQMFAVAGSNNDFFNLPASFDYRPGADFDPLEFCSAPGSSASITVGTTTSSTINGLIVDVSP